MKNTLVKIMVIIIDCFVIGIIAAISGALFGSAVALILKSMSDGLSMLEQVLYLTGGCASGYLAVTFGWPMITKTIPEFLVGLYNKYIKEFIE